MCNSAGRFGSFVAGIAIGAGAALLYTPYSGAQARKWIGRLSQRYARDAKEELWERGAALVDKGREMVDAATEQGEEALKAGVDSIKDTAQKAVGR